MTLPENKSSANAVRTFWAASLITAGLGFYAALPAQTFETADWFEREIGDGVVWRNYEFDSLFGARQNITYIEADLDNPNVVVELPHLVTGVQRTSQMIPNQFPAALGGVNGTYFSFDSGTWRHNTYFRFEGTEIPRNPRTKSAWGHHAALAQNASDEWEIIEMPGTAGEWDDNATHPTIMANGPLLVTGGAVASSHIATVGGTHCSSRHPRTAVGITSDNKLILLTADGRTDRGAGLTCDETAQVLLWLDVVEGVNMDGGGTTTMYIKDEPNSGVVNYPSDAGGERSTANTIAVVAPAAAPAQWDARLMSMTFTETVAPDESQTVTLVYRNIGTDTWTQADTQLITARPEAHASSLYEAGWVSPSQPALMSPASVSPGNDATFSFPITSPDVTSPVVLYEYFMLTQDGVGRIGPSDARARLKLVVIPETPTGDSFLVEPRSGGQNVAWYSDSGFLDSGAHCTAPGATGTIGSRYASTDFSVVGLRTATWRPNFPDLEENEPGQYHVSVAWPEGNGRQENITYHVDHDGGRDTFLLNQQGAGNTWYPLGIFTFSAGQSDNGRVQMTNENTDISGNMFAGPVRFLLIDEPTSVEDWNLY